MFKRDDIKFGLLLGFLAPLISLVIYYLARFYPLYTVSDFFNFVVSTPNQVTAITVPCLVLNIALFTFYINSHRDQTAKGIFAVTLVFAIGALVFKYIF
jgi:hypothetical protein